MKLRYPAGATPLDPDEMAGLLPSSIGTQGELDAFEQANIGAAERWALNRKRQGILSDEFIRGLHRRMFNEVWRWAGRYRTTNKNIGEAWPHIPVKVQALCDDVGYWIERQTYGWDEIGARFHHRLVAVHPFPNGNGRHARLMTDVLLSNHGQPLFTWGSRAPHTGSETRDRYIAALRAADARDHALLIAFVRS
jgi:Fic-DOC domain mobile mystery protein B